MSEMEFAPRCVEHQHDQVRLAQPDGRLEVALDRRRDYLFAGPHVVSQRADQRALANTRRTDEGENQWALGFVTNRADVKLFERRPDIAQVTPTSHL